MKKFFVTVAIFGVMLAPMVFSTSTVARRSQKFVGLAPAPAPIGAGAGVAAAMGLVTAPADFVYALRGGGTTDFWQYNISGNAWVILPSTPAPVEDGGAIVEINSYSFCSQGEGKYCLATLRGGNTTDFWVYDIKAKHWCIGPNTPAPVGSGGAIAQLQGIGAIYALRGAGTTDFWKFEDGVWTKLANTPGPITAGGGLVGINYGTRTPRPRGLLYAIQGDGSSAVWSYQGDTNTWTTIANTPAPIGSGGGITAPNAGSDGTLVILQGGGSKTVWSLDIAENSWESLNSPSNPVEPGGAISNQFNGCSFAFAGGGSNEFFSTGIRDCLVNETGPDFSINFAQPSVTAAVGTKIKARLNIVRDNGFTGKITLTQASPKLQGIVVPEDIQIPESDSYIIKIKVKGTAQKGTFPLTFAGVDTSGKVRNATLTLTID